MRTVQGYREWMARYAAMRLSRSCTHGSPPRTSSITVEAAGRARGTDGAKRRKPLETIFAKAREKERDAGIRVADTVVDGRRVIREDPPVLTHVEIDRAVALEDVFEAYRPSLPESRRDFLERYQFVDIALKVVGVGSVGTRCFVIVLQGRDEDEPLILQAKEATASVLDPYLATSAHEIHGQRVVVGQQLMQANSDIFLGWSRRPTGSRLLLPPALGHEGIHRARRPPANRAWASTATSAAGPWPWPTRDRRRGGDLGLPGKGDSFDGAIADFAETYADINARDHAAYVAAIGGEDLDAGGLIVRSRGHGPAGQFGEPGGIRTHDQGIKSPVLCR